MNNITSIEILDCKMGGLLDKAAKQWAQENGNTSNLVIQIESGTKKQNNPIEDMIGKAVTAWSRSIHG